MLGANGSEIPRICHFESGIFAGMKYMDRKSKTDSLTHSYVMFIALDSMNGFCSNNNRSLKPVSIENQVIIYERAHVHILKSLHAQLTFQP